MLDFLKTKSSLKKILFIPDQHFPYNDKKYWNLLMKVAKEVKFNIIAIMGDFLDCYSVSDYSKDPQRKSRLKDEVKSAKVALRELEALKAERYLYIEGNHEDRVWRLIKSKAPEFDGLVSIERLLDLDKWEYTPYMNHTTIGKLNLTHDVGHAGKYAAFQTLDAFQDNVGFGHTHRLAVVYQGNVKGVPHVCANFGWGGDVSKIDYMHQAKAKKDWMLGFGVGYLEPNGIVHLQVVPVVKYKCVVDGKFFQ